MKDANNIPDVSQMSLQEYHEYLRERAEERMKALERQPLPSPEEQLRQMARRYGDPVERNKEKND